MPCPQRMRNGMCECASMGVSVCAMAWAWQRFNGPLSHAKMPPTSSVAGMRRPPVPFVHAGRWAGGFTGLHASVHPCTYELEGKGGYKVDAEPPLP